MRSNFIKAPSSRLSVSCVGFAESTSPGESRVFDASSLFSQALIINVRCCRRGGRSSGPRSCWGAWACRPPVASTPTPTPRTANLELQRCRAARPSRRLCSLAPARTTRPSRPATPTAGSRPGRGEVALRGKWGYSEYCSALSDTVPARPAPPTAFKLVSDLRLRKGHHRPLFCFNEIAAVFSTPATLA